MEQQVIVKGQLLNALEKACEYYIRETDFGSGSWWCHGETGRSRATKIIKYVEYAQDMDIASKVHWIMALACMESGANVLISTYIAPFIERSSIFTLDEIHSTLNSLSYLASEADRRIAAIQALIKLRLDIKTIRVADRLRENMDDCEADNHEEILQLLREHAGNQAGSTVSGASRTVAKSASRRTSIPGR